MQLSGIESILEKYKDKTKKGSGYLCAVRHLYFLRRLKRSIKKIRLSQEFSENSIKYLTDNFPKIEQCMSDSARELFHLKSICISGKLPTYFKVFSQYADTLESPLDAKLLCCLFEKSNACVPYPAFEDSAAFPLYMKSVLCEKIVLFYTSDKEKDEKLLQMLFQSLDETLVLDKEDSLASNEAEKILLKDRIYRNSTNYTKDSYRRNLSYLAKKAKTSQLEYAKALYRESDNFTCSLADKPFGGQVYILLHIFLTVLFTFFLSCFSPLLLLSFVPVYRCVKLILDRFFARFVLKGFTEPSLELSHIPDGCGVLVTVTTLLTGKDTAVFSRLEEMYCTCGEKNVYFSLLCDLCDSDEAQIPSDNETVRYARENILALRKKYGDVFFLFIRDRTFSQSEGKFIAPERKRGAVNCLCSFLCGKSDGFNCDGIKPSYDICNNIKYVFTLDSDTRLAFDSVRRAAGIMLHPVNAPVYDENTGRVVKGYGILQPKMSTALNSSMKSFFTSFMCHESGVDFYSSAGYNQVFALFGKGVFCGKGMFDKEIFYKALCQKYEFAKNTVLSHDAPEGALLRCVCTNHITLTDSFPREQMSYNKRRHRWIRGDIQNLHFFGKTRKNCHGDTVNCGIDYVSGYLMVENIADALLPCFSYILLMLSLVLGDGVTDVLLVTSAVSCYILPFVHTVVSSIRRAFFYNLSRLFYSKGVYGAIWTSFFRMFYELSAIAQNSLLCTDATVRALFRHFISHRHNLEWTTAAQSDAESKDGALGYVRKNLFSTFSGTILIVCTRNSFVMLLGLLWNALPVTAYFQGKAREVEKAHIPSVTKSVFIENLKDMWQFFEDNVGEKTHFLPPDNVSFRENEKISHMTSPTNIGLYLASCAAAYKSGLLCFDGFINRIDRTVSTLESLPKYAGLLYNWYDVYTAQPLEPHFVSSVDEGNFLACLYVVVGAIEKSGEKTQVSEKLKDRVKALIDKADFSLMYNSRRKLFFIGFTVEKDGRLTYGKNCYDMLMSETRTLSYLAIARRKVSVHHLAQLTRPLISSGRYVGIASWSGTAFEYFMPCIFLPSYKNSFTDEALKFALSMNVKNGAVCDGTHIFGISESCYNKTDDSGSYMYYAFGVPKLAMCVFEQKKIISPYSSYLMLESSPRVVLENLKNMHRIGLYGKYGFYESCDAESKNKHEDFAVVKSFMSHHLGMSICALCNFLFDGYIRDCFMSDVYNKSAAILLEEKIPDEVYIKKRARRYYRNLSKPVMRPRQNNDENDILPRESNKTVENTADDLISVSLFDGETPLVSQTCNGEGFGKMYHRRQSNYSLTVFDGVREPIRIFALVCDTGKEIRFEAQRATAHKVVTEAGAVVFYGDNMMYFLYGFYLDENGNGHQGVCFADSTQNKGCISFPPASCHTQAKYILCLGRSKSFEGIYNCEKRAVEDYDGILQRAQSFYRDTKTDMTGLSAEEDILSRDVLTDTDTSPFILPVGKTVSERTASLALKLMYTECSLREYVCLELCRRLYYACDSRKVCMLICRLFCAYAQSLDEHRLAVFAENNAESYRLVLKSLLEMKDLDASEKELYRGCLLRLEKLCTRLHDHAAGRIVSASLEALGE